MLQQYLFTVICIKPIACLINLSVCNEQERAVAFNLLVAVLHESENYLAVISGSLSPHPWQVTALLLSHPALVIKNSVCWI
jgi:hypothetical protein